MRATAIARLSLLLAMGGMTMRVIGAEPTPGLVEQKPADGFFVETDQGFMVPYEAAIPGADVKYKMTPIPGGRFKLGSPMSEPGRKLDEGPQQNIDVEPCWIGAYEVTWAEYKSYMAMNKVFRGFEIHRMRPVPEDKRLDAVSAPSQLYDPEFVFQSGSHPRQPALSMSQLGAKQYTKWLSLLTGRFYRLPTEAEWEYACRAGTTTAYSFGNDAAQLGDYAWYRENSDERTHQVGRKKPNAWGLYDMHGNVGEWVLDAYSEEGYAKLGGMTRKAAEAVNWPTKLYPRVVRGGTWDFEAVRCRSAARLPSDDAEWLREDADLPQSVWWYTSGDALGVGFRILRPLTPPPERERHTKYWNADTEKIQSDLDQRIDNEGRGVRGIVDKELPAAIRQLREDEAKGK